MKKLLLCFVVLALASPFVFASGEQEEGGTEKEIVLDFWAAAGRFDPFFENEIFPEFEAKYPNIKIQKESSPSAELLKKVIPALAAGEGPHLTMGNQQFYTPLVEQQLCYPIPETIVDDQYMKDNYIEGADVGVSFGKRFGVPTGVMAPVIYMNKEMVREAGITSMGESWDEYLVNAKKMAVWEGESLARAGGTIVDNNAGYMLLGLVYQQGGEYFSDDGKKSYLDTPELLNAIKLGRQVFDMEINQVGFPNGQEAFASERAASTVQWTWYGSFLLANHPDVDWTCQKMPRFGDGTSGPYGRSNSLSTQLFVTKQAEGDALDASWKFWEYLMLDRNADFSEVEGTVTMRKDGINASWINDRIDLRILKEQLLDPDGGYVFPVAVPQPLLDHLNNLVETAIYTRDDLSNSEIRQILKDFEEQLDRHLSRRNYPFAPEA